ncbi:MAG: site-2 protease family protein [Planctomycetaceae bacterium]
MFGMAGETEFDVRFLMFGVPVRIHPIFWLSSAWIVWGAADGDLRKVLIGVLCIFVSVLVHELGHALVSKRYGFPSEIVLFILGGYATATRFSAWKNVKVSAAGPAAGLLLFGLTYAVLRILMVQNPQSLADDGEISFALRMMLFANLTVSLMNLVPVLPLDGGRITESLMNRYGGRDAVIRTMQIGIAASAVVVLRGIYCINNPDALLVPMPQALLPPFQVGNMIHTWLVGGLQPEPKFMTLFFGFLCANQFAEYNDYQGRR